MTEQTAPWIWPDVYDTRETVTFAEAELAYVRSMIVWWDSAENGAAGIEAPIEQAAPKNAALIIDLFLNNAVLTAREGDIENPYACSDDLWRINDAPDPELVEAFAKGGPKIPFKVTQDDLKLWEAANRTNDGIDCKRPFGSESVSRDLRAILDPDKTIKTSAFTKHHQTAQARMFLFLQFFVQKAELAFGDYVRGASYRWQPEADFEHSDKNLTRGEWVSRIVGMVMKQNAVYAKTGAAVALMCWENRLKGDYGSLSKTLSLHNLYEDFHETRYVGRSRDMAEACLAAFGLSDLPLEQQATLASLVRVLNGTGDFAAAKAAMQAGGVWDIDVTTFSSWPLNAETLFYLEACVARLGLGEISGGGFLSMAFPRQIGSSFTYDILYGQRPWNEGRPKDLRSDLYHHARALAAQVQIMR